VGLFSRVGFEVGVTISESLENGLMILSAKYGVKACDSGDAAAWGAAEVADVTVAVAVLVDRGQLLIPPGVQKSYMPGLWDPAPSRGEGITRPILIPREGGHYRGQQGQRGASIASPLAGVAYTTAVVLLAVVDIDVDVYYRCVLA
jgi:hypothetical protein